MLFIDVIAAGRLRDPALLSLWQDYTKRLQWPLTLHEIESKKPGGEAEKILARLRPDAKTVILDERGKSLRSNDFATLLQSWATDGTPRIQFVIGGADGTGDDIRKKADFLLSFGAQTWPHMLARVMLAEQLYRARQILSGHPYHRE